MTEDISTFLFVVLILIVIFVFVIAVCMAIEAVYVVKAYNSVKTPFEQFNLFLKGQGKELGDTLKKVGTEIKGQATRFLPKLANLAETGLDVAENYLESALDNAEQVLEEKKLKSSQKQVRKVSS